jgi:hypothetical protein
MHSTRTSKARQRIEDALGAGRCERATVLDMGGRVTPPTAGTHEGRCRAPGYVVYVSLLDRRQNP